jgi:hypothetical protein
VNREERAEKRESRAGGEWRRGHCEGRGLERTEEEPTRVGGTRESREQRAENREQRAESREQRVESREQGAESREQRAESREQRAESREQRAESREQRAENSNRIWMFLY